MKAFLFFPVAIMAAFSAPMAHAQNSTLLSAVEINNAVNVIDDLHISLTNLMLSDEVDLAARKELIAPALTKAFDLPAMTKAVLGSRAWRGATPNEQEQAKDAFKNWMITQYASRFTRSKNPKFSTRETRDGGINTIVVETVLRTSKRLVNLDYRMRKNGTDFQIIDVFLDGRVSEVALRKSEYRQLVKSQGVAGFTDALNKKSKDAGASPS
ncbi:MAG: ABC transporter substrate-binding protein [Pseudomonadota bacterium]